VAEQGAILLEVVLALALFVLAATIITGGLSSAANEVRRLHLQLHAQNLAATVLAELQMGILPGDAGGPNQFDPPFQAWSWQTTVGPINELVAATNSIQKVEVTIRHQTEPTVMRLTQFVPLAGNGTATTPAAPSGGS
jgi:type II secretory pathway pseudopilin PulG